MNYENLIEDLKIDSNTFQPVVLVNETWYTIEKFTEVFCDKTRNRN